MFGSEFTFINRLNNRIRHAAKSLTMFLLAVAGIGALTAVSFSQAQNSEDRLRSRMSGYWDAMQKADYDAAATYIHPDSRSTFAKVPRSRILSWSIKSLGCNEEHTVCDTITIVKKPMPGIGVAIDWELHNQWVLHEGEWYFKIPWDEYENPLLEAFKERQEVAKVAPLPESPSSPADPSVIKRLAESMNRMMPDPENPSIVHFGEKRVFRYTYLNDGEHPIRILSAHADCHCTTVQTDYPEVLPGQTGVFEIVLDTFGLPLGALNKEVYVQFDDLSTPLKVPISVTNLPNFALTPSSVDFGTLETGATAERSVRLVNESGSEVKILSHMKSDPGLEVSLDKTTLGPQEAASIVFRYSPVRSGEFFDNLMLHTDLDAEPLLNIPVHGVAKN
jgi:hypothetical protein